MTNKNPDEEDYDPKKEITSLAANLEQPDKFAQIFCVAAEKSKAIDEVLKKIFRSLLTSDNETINSLKQIQRIVNKEDSFYILKRIGIVLWTLFCISLGTLLPALVKKFL